MKEQGQWWWLCLVPVCATAFLLANGGAAIATPITERLLQSACEHYSLEPSSKECKNDKRAQHLADTQLFWFMLANYGPQFFTVTASAHLGDVFGRQWSISLSALGAGATLLFAALIPIRFFYSIFIPAVAIANLTGGHYCGLAGVFAAVADRTTTLEPEQRQLVFGIVEGIFWVGLIVGPSVVGVLAQNFGAQNSLLYPAVCNLACAVVAVLFMRSAHSKSEVLSHKCVELAQCNPFLVTWKFFRRTSLSGVLGLNIFLIMSGFMCISAVTPVWLRNHMKYSYSKIGFVQTIVYAANATGLLVIMPLAHQFGAGAKRLMLIACSSFVLWPLLWALGVNPFAGACLSCLAAMFFPIARTAVATMYPPSEYGVSLGVIATLQAAATVFGSTVAPSLLNLVGWKSALYFCAVLAVAAVVVTAFLPKELYAKSTRADEDLPIREVVPVSSSSTSLLHKSDPQSYSSTS